MRLRIGAGIWIIVAALICIIIGLLIFFLVVNPQRSKASEVDGKISEVEQSILQEQNKLNQLKQYQKDPEQFIRQIDVLKERVPENVELADIIQQIDYAAEESGLDFYRFTPKVPQQVESFYVLTCDALFYGRYFNLVEFFNHIERLPRSVKVVYLQIQESDDGLPYLEISITFKAFFTTNVGIEGLFQAPS